MDTLQQGFGALFAQAMSKKNDRFTVEITSITDKGFGVATAPCGRTLFVEGALPGETCLVHVLKVHKTYAYAKIIEIINTSADRVQPACALAGKCGGCQFQHASYAAQLRYKQDIVKNALQRIGGIQNPPVSEIIGMDEPWAYRNKAAFPIVPHDNSVEIGMYAARSHRIIPVQNCPIQHPAHAPILKAMRHFMQKYRIPAYNEATHKGLLRHIIVRTSLHTGEVMAVVVANAKRVPHEADMTDLLEIAGATSIILNVNDAPGNTITGGENRVLRGHKRITEQLGGIKYRLSAPSFFQVNPIQAAKLYDTAIRQAGLTGGETIIDAHCGVGGIALAAAPHAHSVIGTDVVHSSTYDAEKNAKLNGITNARFICGAAEEVLPRILESHQIVALDPPRKGCEPQLISTLTRIRPAKIIYVSCDPATMARDIKKLAAGGYTLHECVPVDMFPMTGKVECSCLLTPTKT
jgi:23S rRNA (uracil1939-C5)-methyltransferase